MSDSDSSDTSAVRFNKYQPGRGVRRLRSSSSSSSAATADADASAFVVPAVDTNLINLVAAKVREALAQQQAPPPKQHRLSLNFDLVSTFDPENSAVTAKNWLTKIDQIGAVHEWSDQTKSYCLQSRLAGIARIWYENLTNYNLSWGAWKEALLLAFPTCENYADILQQMLDYKKSRFETMKHYYYYKHMLVTKCGITDSNAVSCIVAGLPADLQANARAGNFATPEDLFTGFLSKFEKTAPETVTSGKPEQPQESRKLPDYLEVRPKLCHTCHKPGHLKSQCNKRFFKPERNIGTTPSCPICKRKGHTEQTCWFKNSRKVHTLNNRQVNSTYCLDIYISGKLFKGYLDTGSQVNVAKAHVAHNLGIKLKSTDIVLKSFGGGLIFPVGIADNISILINNISFHVTFVFVEATMEGIDVIIGQPVINDERLKVTINGPELTISSLETCTLLSPSPQRTTVQVYQDTYIPARQESRILVTAGEVGDSTLFSSRLHASGKEKYTIPTQLLKGPISAISVINLAPTPMVWNQHRIVGRGDRISVREVDLSLLSNLFSTLKIDVSKINYGCLQDNDKESLFSLLRTYENCFAFDTNDLGVTDLVEFDIALTTETPVSYKPYRLSQQERIIVREKTKELLDAGIIRPSNSNYSSPVILIKKRTGGYRLCVDYRALNKLTIKDRYPLVHIEDQISRLHGSVYYVSLDMAQGYHQIPVSESSIPKTAFVTPDGQYEYLRIPFGCSNAPAAFSRLINQVLGDLRHTKVLVYLDDILIPSKTIADGLETLEEVLKLFRKANLKFNLDKCFFFKENIEYLGYEISQKGIRPCQRKITAVTNFKTPQNIHELRQFLGLSSYFRKFVQNFSKLTAPLCQLLKKGKSWEWGCDQDGAFAKIKSILTTRPLLAIYNPDAKTEVHTDACSRGIAGILLQWQNAKLHPVYYFSRLTTREESLYHSYELETLAVVESLKRFRIYLVGIPVKIVTDCSAVRATFLKKDMLPRVARWWLSIQDFDIEIEHRPGERLKHADALSRNPVSISLLNEIDWIVTLQMEDPKVCNIYRLLQTNTANEDIKSNYVIHEGRVCKLIANGGYRPVIPKSSRFSIMRKYHDDIGHIGLRKCEALIKSKYWFERMTQFIKKYVNACIDCQFKKGQYGRKEGYLHPIQKPDRPFHTIHIDHLGPFSKVGNKGYCYILMIIDSFSKYTFCRPTRTVNAQEVCDHLRDLFSLFERPERIISDRGKAFTSSKFNTFVVNYHIKHVLNAVASPRSNGQVERYNRTIIDRLNTSVDHEGQWLEKLPDVVWGINHTINASTGMTPHQLLFNCDKDDKPLKNQVDISDMRQKTKRKLDQVSEQMKRSFDKKRKKSVGYYVGDLVLWAGATTDEKEVSKKLKVRYGGPYKITKALGNDRYEIVPLKGIKGYKKFKTVVAAESLRKYTNKLEISSDSDVNSTDELIDLLEG